jgi:hypothetical protein
MEEGGGDYSGRFRASVRIDKPKASVRFHSLCYYFATRLLLILSFLAIQNLKATNTDPL